MRGLVWMWMACAKTPTPIPHTPAATEPPAVGAALVPQTGHLGPVNDVDLSADGRRAATAGEDGVILVWDAEASLSLRRLEGHADAVSSARFSPDGAQLASASVDGSAAIWDVRTGTRQVVLTGHTSAVRGAVWSPAGNAVLTWSSDGTAGLWDPRTGRRVAALTGHTGPLTSASFAPDGLRILTTSEDGAAAVWDGASGAAATWLRGHTGHVTSGAFDLSGTQVVTGSADRSAIVWDVANGRPLHVLNGHREPVRAVGFTPDGASVVSGGDDGAVITWSARSGRRERRWTVEAAIQSVAISPDGHTVLAVDARHVATTWSRSTGLVRHTIDAPLLQVRDARFSRDGEAILGTTWLSSAFVFDAARFVPKAWLRGWVIGVASVAFSPDGLTVAAGGAAHLWDLDAPDPLVPLLDGGPSWAVAFSPDGARLASVGGAGVTWWTADDRAAHPLTTDDATALAWAGSDLATGMEDGTVRWWGLANDRDHRRFVGHRGSVTALAASPDGHRLASAGEDGTVRLWQRDRPDPIAVLEAHRGKVRDLRFAPDGRTLVSAGWDGTVHLWNADGTSLRSWTCAGPLYGAVFSPDGRTIATASSRGVVELWTIDGQLVRTLAGHTDQVGVLAFSPDGMRLASGSFDHSAILWDVGSGAPIRRLVGHLGRVFGVAFSADGARLATGSLDGTVRIWDGRTGAEQVTLGRLGQTWAVTDPAGRFDASADGDVLGLAWVIGDEPYDLMQLQPDFYDPGLLAKTLGLRAEPVRPVPRLADVLPPPRLVAAGPTPDGRFTLRAVERGGGIGTLFVRLNGTDISDRIACPDLLAGCTVDLSALPAWLRGEQNAVEVRIRGARTEVRSRGLDLTSVAEGTPDVEPPDLWIASVGTSDYAGNALDLQYAGLDATRFADALGRAGATGFGPTHTHVRTWSDASGAPATAGTLEQIGEWLADAHARDTFVLFLSGHGVALGAAGADDYFYLLPTASSFDALSDPTVRGQSAWSGEEIARVLAAVPPLKRLVVLDTCASGKLGDQPLSAARGLPSEMVRAHVRARERTGAWLLAGAAADQPSYEASRYGQGVLTYTLLEGLRGPALDPEQIVTVGNLAAWVERMVPEHAAGIGGIQRPVIRRGEAGDFPLGQLTAADIGAIPLQPPLPVVVAARIVPVGGRADRLGVELAVNRALQEAAANGKGAFVVWNTPPQEDTWQITGQYTEKARTLKLEGYLSRQHDGSVEEIPFAVSGADPAALATAVVEQVTRSVR